MQVTTRSALAVSLFWLAACAVDTTPPGPTPTPTPIDAPTLLTTVPAAGSTDAPTSTSLTLIFSKPLDRASLQVTITPTVTLGAPVWNDDSTEASFGSMSLAGGTQYSVVVSGKSADGIAMDAKTIAFTTRMPDTVAPTLVSSVPADGAMGVVTSTTLALTFSERLEPDSLELSLDPGVAEAGRAWNATGTVVTVTFAEALKDDTAFSVAVKANDLAGNALAATQLTFHTAAPADVTAPVVEGSAPALNATSVPTTAALSLSFSEAMNKAAVDAAFSISPPVAGAVLWDADSRLRSFQPSAPLTAGTQYTVTLGTGAADLAGNALAAPYVVQFTTANAPDTTPPTLVSSAPAAGEKLARPDGAIVLTFSEPMDKASAQVSFSITNPMGLNAGTFSWSADGKTMTFRREALFLYGQIVTWRITSGAKDLAGNALQQVSRGYVVVNRDTVYLDATATLDGYVSNGGAVQAGSSTLLVGDSGANLSYRGFLSFDLSGVPMEATAIVGARVGAYISGSGGDPMGTLGGTMRLQHLTYGPTLTASAYDAPHFMGPKDVLLYAQTPSTGWRVGMMTEAVAADWAASRTARSQFRLAFPNQTSANSQADYVSFYSSNTAAMTCQRAAGGSSCKPYLAVVYEYP